MVHNDVNKTSEDDEEDQEVYEEVNGNGRNHSSLTGLNKLDNGCMRRPRSTVLIEEFSVEYFQKM